MSVDTYFCMCCLSTDDLTCLTVKSENNYVELLTKLCAVKLPEEICEDSFICGPCRDKLKEAVEFREQVFNTINILEGNGLIELLNEKEFIIVKKISDYDENKVDIKVPIEELSSHLERIDQEKDVQEPKARIKNERVDEVDFLEDAYDSKIRKNRVKDRDKKKVINKASTKEYEVTNDLKCNHCGIVLPNARVFHAHINKHFPNHICETCGKVYPTEQRLKRHLSSHDVGPFECADCDSVFSNYNTFNSHRQRKHSSVHLYACPRCPQRFPTFTSRAKHLVDLHGYDGHKYACHVCQRTFITASHRSSHIKNSHRKAERRVKPKPAKDPDRFRCAVCNKCFSSKYSLQVHMRTHTGYKPFTCDICAKSFTQKCILNKHYKFHKKKDLANTEIGTSDLDLSKVQLTEGIGPNDLDLTKSCISGGENGQIFNTFVIDVLM